MDIEIACAGHGEVHREVHAARYLNAARPDAFVVGGAAESVAGHVAGSVVQRDGFDGGVRIHHAVALEAIFADWIAVRSGVGTLERGIICAAVAIYVRLRTRGAQQHFNKTRMLARREAPVCPALLQRINDQCRATRDER